MQLSTVLLSCLFILCVGRTIDTPLKYLKLDTGRVAAFCLMILAFGALNPSLSGEFSFNAGTVLMLLITGRFAKKTDGNISRAIVYAMPASLLMFAVKLSGYGGFAPLALLPFILTLGFSSALFVAALSPLLICVYTAALDLYLYGYANLIVGDISTLGLQVMGLYIAAALSFVMLYRRSRLKADDL